jgi:hypothetical protein
MFFGYLFVLGVYSIPVSFSVFPRSPGIRQLAAPTLELSFTVIFLASPSLVGRDSGCLDCDVKRWRSRGREQGRGKQWRPAGRHEEVVGKKTA